MEPPAANGLAASGASHSALLRIHVRRVESPLLLRFPALQSAHSKMRGSISPDFHFWVIGRSDRVGREQVNGRYAFEELEIAAGAPRGMPNVAARKGIKITDIAPIVAGIDSANSSPALLNRSWNWPGPTGKPGYTHRADGRELKSNRGPILADGFYELTRLEDPKPKQQDERLFIMETRLLRDRQYPAQAPGGRRDPRAASRTT